MPEPVDLSRRTFLAAAAAGTTVAAAPAMLPGRHGVMAAATPPAAKPSARRFVHPGMLHTAADLARLKVAVAERRQPLWDGYQALAADPRSSADYTIRNTGQITTWGRGPTDWTGEASLDAAAAYQNALLWAVTGEPRHADKARDILNAWTASLTAITGADGQLGAGLQALKLLNGAEILRHSGYDGWSADDIAACEQSFRQVWYPAISGYALFANGNWDVAALQSVLAIAIFCDDATMFEEAIRYAVDGAGNGRLTHTIVNGTGQGQESGRTQAYAQLAIALLSTVAEMAWNQGVDLYGFAERRLLAGHEYVARYNLGDDTVPFEPDLDRTGKYIKTAVSTNNRGQWRPIWERPLAHYVGRLGGTAPFTHDVVFRGTGGARIVEGYHEDHPSWGTFTCAEPTRIGSRPLGVPATPSGLVARPLVRGIELSWVTSLDPRSGVEASSYTVRRSIRPDGPFLTVATRVNDTTWTDVRATGRQVYHYVVTASNVHGESSRSATVSLSPTLPRPWTVRDVGPVRRTGTAAFDGRRFLIEASGQQIGADRDDFAFVQARLRGQGTITARIVYPVSSQYTTLGVMMRAGGDAAAAHAAMLIKGLPLHTWSGVWTTRSRPGGVTSATGSIVVPPTQQQAITVDAGFPISQLGTLPESATPLTAPHVEGASDGYRLRQPYWVRLTRRGDTFIGAISPDGKDWTEVGRSEIAMPKELQVGLAVCSGLGVAQDYAETTTAAFDNIAVTGWQTPAPQHRVTDLRAAATDSAIELSWTDPDLAGAYTVRRATGSQGPFAVIARDVAPVGFGVALRYTDPTGRPGQEYAYTVSATNVDGSAPRSSVARAKMPHPPVPEIVDQQLSANVGVPVSYRVLADHNPDSFDARGLPRGLRLDPHSGTLSGTPRTPGEHKVQVTARNAAGSVTATLTLTVGTPPEAPWSYSDIGDTVSDMRELGAYGVVLIRRTGSTSIDSSTGELTVRGAGSGLNIIGQGYAGQFLRQPWSGDGSITARLLRQSGTGTSDQVGLVMAKSLNPFDHLAAAVVGHQSNGQRLRQFLRRPKVAGAATTIAGPAVPDGPLWLRLSRRGLTFAAETSPDGTEWTRVGAGTIDAFGAAPYYLGLIVTSGAPTRLSTAVFDSVQLTGAG